MGGDSIHKYMFPKMDVVTSLLLSQKNIYIYNAAKSRILNTGNVIVLETATYLLFQQIHL